MNLSRYKCFKPLTKFLILHPYLTITTATFSCPHCGEVRLYVHQEPMIPQRLLACHVLIWSIWCHLWLEKAKPQRNCNAAFVAPCRQQFVPFPVQSVTLGGQIVFLPPSPYFYCLSSSSSAHYGLLLSPANLISRLLLRMRRIYVCSIRLDFH